MGGNIQKKSEVKKTEIVFLGFIFLLPCCRRRYCCVGEGFEVDAKQRGVFFLFSVFFRSLFEGTF